MPERQLTARASRDGCRRKAVFDESKTYRYKLDIEWGPSQPLVVIGLNPSTADELVNDPTVERCERRARALGYGGLIMLNLFALRATDPKEMLASAAPHGQQNMYWIDREACRQERDILCAWGKHGRYLGQDQHVFSIIAYEKLFHLGLNGDGTPKHPLYRPYSQELEPFN